MFVLDQWDITHRVSHVDIGTQIPEMSIKCLPGVYAYTENDIVDAARTASCLWCSAGALWRT